MDAVAWVALFLVVLAWTWAAILWRIDRRYPGITTLHVMARAQEWGAFLGTLVALLAAARLHIITIPNDVAVVMLIVILLGINVPGILALWLYLTGRYSDGT